MKLDSGSPAFYSETDVYLFCFHLKSPYLMDILVELSSHRMQKAKLLSPAISWPWASKSLTFKNLKLLDTVGQDHV